MKACVMGSILAACSITSTGNAGDVNPDALAKCVQQAWKVTWERFYLPRTHLFYDYLTSYDSGRELAHLPTPEEAQRQYPNECGYGTGMEDCMISAGVMLSLIVDRYAVTKDEVLRQRAEQKRTAAYDACREAILSQRYGRLLLRLHYVLLLCCCCCC